MKVAIFYSGSKTGGGVDTYLANLFESRPQDVELTLLSLGEWKLSDRLKVKGERVKVFYGKWWNLLNILKIATYLKKNKFDLIVSQSMVANFYARIASFLSRVPSLVTVHSDWRTDYRGYKKILFYLFDRFLRFQTRHYITVSEYLKKQLISEGISEEKITVVYNGAAPSKHHTTYHKPRTSNEIIIGSIGRLHPVKNFDQLIVAIKELGDRGLGVQLQIAGEGSERKRLEGLVRKNGIEKYVKLLGWQEDLDKLFSRWDLYVQPSITEGFGLAVVEAMLAGLPVVVTPGGALSELVENGRTGIIAEGFHSNDLAKAIQKLVEDGGMTEVAKLARSLAQERFGIEKWAKETVFVYGKAAK